VTVVGGDDRAAGRDPLASRAEQAAGLGSWELDLDSGEVVWSDNLFRLMGLEVGEVDPTVEYFLSHTHPDDRAELRDAVERLRAGEDVEFLEYRIVRPGGEVRYLRVFRATSVNEPPGPRRVIGAVQDVTGQRRAEREVLAYRAVTEAIGSWRTLADSGEEVLAGLARALDAVAGAIWVNRRDGLSPIAVWCSQEFDGDEFREATAKIRLPRGSGLAGHAWERCEPVVLADGVRHDFQRERVADEHGLGGGVAFPAIAGGESLAVVELLAREQIALTESLALTLTAIGHQLGRFLDRRRAELEPLGLTAREVEVLQLAANGLSGPRIAEHLVISPATVKTHFENVYAKLGVPDRAAAVAEVLRRGVIE
jgi:PAS domain S-box-containing protein